MRLQVLMLVVVATGWIDCAAALDQAVSFPEQFSCVWKTEGQADTIVRVKGKMIRLDGKTPDGMAYTVIFDNPRKMTIRWNKASGIVHSENLDRPMPPFFFPENLTWEALGEEPVAGKACRKFRCRPKDGEGDEAILWVEKGTGFPARMQAKGEPAQVWSDLKVGPQDEGQFHAPNTDRKNRGGQGRRSSGAPGP